MGVCDFDPQTLSYAGTPTQQVKCLMRGMDASRNLGPPLDNLPHGLARRIGKIADLPSREALAAYLSRQDLEADLASICGSRYRGSAITIPMRPRPGTS